jgi:hypothetical protein
MQADTPDVVISIAANHAVVSRYRHLPGGSISCERAQNAADLESAALEVIATQDQPVLLGREYPCPLHIAAQAIWPDV